MKGKILASFAALALAAACDVCAAGWPTFDVSNWLSAIERVYQNYDMINNTIDQIENQYKQIQQAVEAAKSIDWDNIKFDGDFDIRNDIKNATKRVNRLLNAASKVQSAITTPSISCGNAKYSIADLCGATSSDMWEGRKNMLTAIQDTAVYMTDNMKGAIKDLSEGLDEKQKKAIWSKYGISPRNYLLVQQSTGQVLKAANNVLATVSKEVHADRLAEMTERNNALIEAAMQTTDSNGNPTQAGMVQTMLQFLSSLDEELAQLSDSVQNAAAVSAGKALEDAAKEEARVAQENENEQNDRIKESRVSGRARR